MDLLYCGGTHNLMSMKSGPPRDGPPCIVVPPNNASKGQKQPAQQINFPQRRLIDEGDNFDCNKSLKTHCSLSRRSERHERRVATEWFLTWSRQAV